MAGGYDVLTGELLQPFEDMGVDALNQVRDTASLYDTTEGTEATRFDGIGV